MKNAQLLRQLHQLKNRMAILHSLQYENEEINLGSFLRLSSNLLDSIDLICEIDNTELKKYLPQAEIEKLHLISQIYNLIYNSLCSHSQITKKLYLTSLFKLPNTQKMQETLQETYERIKANFKLGDFSPSVTKAQKCHKILRKWNAR